MDSDNANDEQQEERVDCVQKKRQKIGAGDDGSSSSSSSSGNGEGGNVENESEDEVCNVFANSVCPLRPFTRTCLNSANVPPSMCLLFTWL